MLSKTNFKVVPESVTAKRGWVKEMELLRGAACIGVVIGHSVVYPNITPLLSVVNKLMTVTVPIFLFISAFLAFYANPNGVPRGYPKKPLIYVGVPYLLWAAIYTWVPVLLGRSQASTFMEYLERLVGGAFHLYFIPIVLQFYLFFILNRYAWFRRILYTPWVLGGSLVLMLSIQALFCYPLNSVFPTFYITFPAWCFYFVLGAWVARWWEDIQKWLKAPWRPLQLAVLLPLGVCFTSILPQVAAFQPFVQVAALLVLPALLALSCRFPNGTFLEPIAQYSFGVYLIHRLPFNQLQHTYAAFDPYAFFLTSFILQGSIGLALTVTLSRLPYLGWAVGARTRRKKSAKMAGVKC